MLEIEKALTEKMKKIWEDWCENECPDRLQSECWMGCEWRNNEDDDET
ncbi:MAG: hypothetical protein ACNYWU_09710 [Desulfobacterales bacterium]